MPLPRNPSSVSRVTNTHPHTSPSESTSSTTINTHSLLEHGTHPLYRLRPVLLRQLPSHDARGRLALPRGSRIRHEQPLRHGNHWRQRRLLRSLRVGSGQRHRTRPPRGRVGFHPPSRTGRQRRSLKPPAGLERRRRRSFCRTSRYEPASLSSG